MIENDSPVQLSQLAYKTLTIDIATECVGWAEKASRNN